MNYYFIIPYYLFIANIPLKVPKRNQYLVTGTASGTITEAETESYFNLLLFYIVLRNILYLILLTKYEKEVSDNRMTSDFLFVKSVCY